MKKEYETPAVVMLLYALAILVAFVSMGSFFSSRTNGNSGGILLLGPALGLFLLAYLFDLLSRILHELRRIREQGIQDSEYFLLDNGKSTGPFPLSQLLSHLREGILKGSAQVQRAGTQNWASLETLKS